MYINFIQKGTKVNNYRQTNDQVLESIFTDEDNYSPYQKKFYKIRTIDVPEDSYRINLDYNTAIGTLSDYTPYVSPNYYEFQIPKSNGGFRTIKAPEAPLKSVQKKIAKHIKDRNVLPHNACHSYVEGRNCLSALTTHQLAESRWFLKLDIKDFFGSIDKDILFNQLRKHAAFYVDFTLKEDYVNKVKDFLELYCFDQGSLPQGAPTSPVLSNLVMVEFDHKLTRILRDFDKNQFTYTRYADDLLISCKYSFRYFPVVQQIKDLLEEQFNGKIKLNEDKTRYGSMNGRNWNLGLMYNHYQNITLGHRRKTLLHAKLHNALLSFRNSADPQYQLKGELAYLKYIEPSYYNSMKGKYLRKFNADIVNHFMP